MPASISTPQLRESLSLTSLPTSTTTTTLLSHTTLPPLNLRSRKLLTASRQQPPQPHTTRTQPANMPSTTNMGRPVSAEPPATKPSKRKGTPHPTSPLYQQSQANNFPQAPAASQPSRLPSSPASAPTTVRPSAPSAPAPRSTLSVSSASSRSCAATRTATAPSRTSSAATRHSRTSSPACASPWACP